MREAYTDQLDSIFADLAAISLEVRGAVINATEALMTGSADVAERVISRDQIIDTARERVEDRAFSLLSRQQPVAGDLRTIVAALRMVSELERMGDLAVHVAKVARLRTPELAIPDPLRCNFTRMAELAQEMTGQIAVIIEERDVDAALALRTMDDEVDKLRRDSFRQLLSSDWGYGVEPAIDIALLGRYYERICDHAVSIGDRVIYVVTGKQPGA